MITVRKPTLDDIKRMTAYRQQDYSEMKEWETRQDGSRVWTTKKIYSAGTLVAKDEPSIPVILPTTE